jgi:hypothetical protein
MTNAMTNHGGVGTTTFLAAPRAPKAAIRDPIHSPARASRHASN